MITYSYKVKGIKCIVKDNLADYVKFVNFDMIAEQDGVKATISLHACLPNVETSTNFVPYNQTTEQDVLGWCLDAVPQEYIDDMKVIAEHTLNEVFTTELPYEKNLIWA